jgi:monoamine oxidase
MSRSFLSPLFRASALAPSAPQVAKWSHEGIKNFLSVFQLEDWLKEATAKTEKTETVAIIGGGLAGLMAGAALARDHHVTVFEASERVGGRVRSNRDIVHGHAVEEGGELIGYGHPAWLYLARRFKLPLSPITEESDYTAMGLKLAVPRNIFPQQPSLEAWRNTLARLAARRGSPRASRADHESAIEALYQELSQEAGKHFAKRKRIAVFEPWHGKKPDRSIAEWLEEHGRGREEKGVEDLTFELENHNGSETRNQSLFAMLHQLRGAATYVTDTHGFGYADVYRAMTENLRCRGGNDRLSEKLCEYIQDHGGRILPNSRVIKVDGREAKQGPCKTKVVVTMADFTCAGPNDVDWSFDKAVVAVPWTKLSGSDPLQIITDTKWTCPEINNGDTVKHIIPAETPFWLNEAHPVAPWAAAQCVGQTWESTDHGATVAQTGPHAFALTAFAGGRAAERARNAGYRDRLQQLFELIPEFDQRSSLVDWTADTHIGCGYACPSEGQLAGLRAFFQLQEHGIYFAGEHTCPPYIGYMEGALQSGCVAAADVRRHPWRDRLNNL